MSKNQVIFTSSKRGIDSLNDGLHIHSYNEAFRGKETEDVRSMFSYQVPGVSMTDELVSDMPQAFKYRRLPEGICALALNTYLGRDYMGKSGRFGNYLSHVIVCGEDDLTNYPCELYGSETFRDNMDFDEVNSSEQPAYLSEPEIKTGYTVNFEAVSEFLSADDNMETYIKMFASMLAFKSASKRTIICDRPENIIMWIAALQYALPRELALNVNFTTYEYNPERSSSQICGVISENTAYSAANADMHFTFDFYSDIVPDIETEGEFFEFMDTCMSISPESLYAFHEFITNNTTYRNPDEQLRDIYALYSILEGNFEDVTQSMFMSVIEVLEKYSKEETAFEFTGKLIEDSNYILSVSDEFAMEILRFLLRHPSTASPETRKGIEKLLADKLNSAFSAFDAVAGDLPPMYFDIAKLCEESKISPDSLLLEYESYESVYKIFSIMMDKADSIDSANKLFLKQMQIKSTAYIRKYESNILNCYYTYLSKNKQPEVIAERKKLLRYVIEQNIKAGFINELIADVFSTIPIIDLPGEDWELMQKVYTYNQEAAMSERMLLAAAGLLFAKAKANSNLNTAIENIRKFSRNNPIGFGSVQNSGVDVKAYICWITLNIYYASARSTQDIIDSYNLFRHQPLSNELFTENTTQIIFAEILTEEVLKNIKAGADPMCILTIVGFLAATGNSQTEKIVGDILKKRLKANDLKMLNERVQQELKNDVRHTTCWNNIFQTATQVSGIMKFFSKKQEKEQ